MYSCYIYYLLFIATSSVVLDSSSSGHMDSGCGYDLAVKAVFNYGAESNSQSILRALEREIVPLRAEGNLIDSAL